MNLSWRIRRVALDLRQRDVADLAGISQARYSVLERSDDSPTRDESIAVERILQLPSETAREIVSVCERSEVP